MAPFLLLMDRLLICMEIRKVACVGVRMLLLFTTYGKEKRDTEKHYYTSRWAHIIVLYKVVS